MATKTSPRGIWQLVGGPVSRSYVDEFLKYGVGLIGPGDAGRWTPGRDDDEFEGGFVRRFASADHSLSSPPTDRQAFGQHPSEDELVAHFVVPLLRALGWPPERIAIKWRRIDVAVFRVLPRTPENCQFVIEAKRLGAGVEGAVEQAKDHVEALGTPRDVVVTDGMRYRMYSCQNDFGRIAYANLARLKGPALELFARMKRP